MAAYFRVPAEDKRAEINIFESMKNGMIHVVTNFRLKHFLMGTISVFPNTATTLNFTKFNHRIYVKQLSGKS